MPKIAIAARAASILLIVSGSAPGLAATGGGSERLSEDARSTPGLEAGHSPQTSQGAARPSCPPRWPYIVLTCVA
ncbi:hypothetical protein C0214_16755 [Methylobacterium sp. DM1]|nr:hypothetical protein C0214_16755 [Methylobacterium sp. DM1]